MKSVVRAIMAGMILCAVPAFAQTAGTADTNMEIFMQKIKADKKLLVASNMGLTDAEGKDFWPLYDAYQKDLQQVNERLGKTINAYAEAYNEGKGTVSNDTAKKLLDEAISVEEQEVKLKRTYSDKIGKVLPAAKTARYIQIENKIRAVIKFQLAQQIPLVY
jgi:Spy/CpxP family protein refolding chaperone